MKLVVMAIVTAVMVWSTGTPAFAQKSTFDVVKERGVLKAGVRSNIPLFGFTDESGKVVGFDVDLVAEIAKSLGVKLEIVPVTGATRIPLLQQGRVDLVAAALGHYRSRDQVIDFSVEYLKTPLTILVKKTSGIKSVADMAGKRIGAAIGAGTVKVFPKVQPKATVQTFEGWPEAFLALQQGLVDAIGTDIVILSGLKNAAPNPADYVMLGKEGTFASLYFGVGVRENDSKWRDRVNFIIQDMWVDGRWDKLFEKWLGPHSKIKLTKEQLGFDMIVWEE